MAFQITAHQMLIFLFIVIVGYIGAKRGVITPESLPHLATFITTLLLPAMGFMATWSRSTRDVLFSNWKILLFAFVYYLILTAVIFGTAKLFRLRGDRDRVFTFCFTFGNLGFVGIPLVTTLMPESMVFYAVFFIIDTAYFWTLGQFWATPHGAKFAIAPRKLFNINVIALLVALVFVVLEVPLPTIVTDSLSSMGGATSACIMLYFGALLCFSNWTPILKCREIYAGIGLKMVAAPLVVALVLNLLGWDPGLVACLSIIPSLPAMTVGPLILEQKGSDSAYASGIMAATLVVSVVTIPLVQFLLAVI